MKKLDLSQTIAVLANVGVIAGIVFLGLELRQNNKLLRAQAGYNLYLNRAEGRNEMFGDPEIAELVVRAESGEPLSLVDARRLRARTERTFLAWQWEFGQWVDGNLAEGELPIESYRRTLKGERDIPGSREIWEAFKFNLRPDFVEWMEERVLSD
jgi:hypothetical protein